MGNIIDSEEQLWDHENQIVCLAANKQQNILAFGDIEGNVCCLNFEEKEQIYNINMNSQKITSLIYS